MNVELHIERLVLDGLSLTTVQQTQLLSGIERGLTALFAGGGLLPENIGASAKTNLRQQEAVTVEGTGGGELGLAIARAVYAGLGADK